MGGPRQFRRGWGWWWVGGTENVYLLLSFFSHQRISQREVRTP